MTSIELGVISVVQRRLEKVDVTLNDTLASLKADSMDTIDILLGVEEEFGIKLPDTALSEVETVEDIVRAVDGALGAKCA
jgi:acyl carrier protein